LLLLLLLLLLPRFRANIDEDEDDDDVNDDPTNCSSRSRRLAAASRSRPSRDFPLLGFLLLPSLFLGCNPPPVDGRRDVNREEEVGGVGGMVMISTRCSTIHVSLEFSNI